MTRLQSGGLLLSAAEHAFSASEKQRALTLVEQDLEILNGIDSTRLPDQDRMVLSILKKKARSDLAGKWERLL